MGDYGYLVSIAIIMLSTKILGDLTKKVSMPQVVGALLAGVIIGPTASDRRNCVLLFVF